MRLIQAILISGKGRSVIIALFPGIVQMLYCEIQSGCFHLAQILRDVAEYVMEDNKELAKSISYTMVANITLFVRILMILLHFSLPDITHLFIYDFYNNDDF